MRTDEGDILEAGKPGGDTQFIQLNDRNHLLLTIVLLLKHVLISFQNYEELESCEKKGVKNNNEAKTQQISSQPLYLNGLIFHLAFIFYLIKVEMGVLSFSLSNISGTRRVEEEEGRKGQWGQVNLDVSLGSGEGNRHGGTVRGASGIQKGPGWQRDPEQWVGPCSG